MNTHHIVVTASHLAKHEGHESVIARIYRLAGRFGFTPQPIEMQGTPVIARIDRSRWLADCECGGAEYVDPDEPFFFCANCGNDADSAKVRPVVFPPIETRQALEALITSRPVTIRGGSTLQQQLLTADESIPRLQRQWDAGESLLKIARENRVAGVQTVRIG